MRAVGPELVNPLVRALAAADPTTRIEAARTAADPRVRSYALGLLAAAGDLDEHTWATGLGDADARVRRRAAELTPVAAMASDPLVAVLADPDVSVVEAAAWALGELQDAAAAVPLARVVLEHSEPLAREAAVAALGAIGAEAGRAAVLQACTDVATVRRRAVLALAAFDGPDVDDALERALTDRDWQTRQAAEDLLGPLDLDD